MHRLYLVGQPIPGIASLPMPYGPDLVVDYEFDLVVALPDPSPEEIQDVTAGRCEFAWIDSDAVGILAMKFGSQQWWDAPFTPTLAKQPPRLPAGFGAGRHQIVTVTLADQNTGIVIGINQFTWSPEFVEAVGHTMKRLLDNQPTEKVMSDAVDAIYARYETPEDMVRHRADVRCVGGTASSSARPGYGRDASPE